MSSIFLDEDVLGYAAGSQNNIVISTRSSVVTGLLQEKLQFSVEADWENIFSLSDRFDSAKKMLGAVDLGLFNAGIFTKKFYKGGSYLKINPKIRVMDWNGTGSPLYAAESLLNMCLPEWNGKLEAAIKSKLLSLSKLPANLKQSLNKSQSEGTLIKDTFSIAGQALLKAGEEVVDALDGTTAKELFNLLFNEHDFLSNSPTTVEVSISNFYKNTFVIDSVNVEFSEEMGVNGPLYVDIQLALSTPVVSIKGSTGLRTSVSQPKFKFID